MTPPDLDPLPPGRRRRSSRNLASRLSRELLAGAVPTLPAGGASEGEDAARAGGRADGGERDLRPVGEAAKTLRILISLMNSVQPRRRLASFFSFSDACHVCVCIYSLFKEKP